MQVKMLILMEMLVTVSLTEHVQSSTIYNTVLKSRRQALRSVAHLKELQPSVQRLSTLTTWSVDVID